MFAIDLHVIDEEDEHEERKRHQQQANGPQLSKELRNFITDDVDKGRQQKRIEYYQKAASPFFSYFNDSRRIVRLHLQVTQLTKLQRHIEHHSENGENYAIILDTLNTTHDKIPRQRIIFFEKTMAFLDEFIKNRNFSKLPSNRERVEVQVMASTADDLLLFMEPFPDSIAKAISLVFDCDQADLKNEND